MDSFKQYRDLTGVWVDGKRVVSCAVEIYDEPDPNEKPAELRISREILAHELTESDVDYGNDLVEFVRKDLTDHERTAFQAYVDMASFEEATPKAKRSILKRFFSKQPVNQLRIRKADGVEGSADVITIKANVK